jgi:serine phosphatase RsbU (regulator of sigma subunit)
VPSHAVAVMLVAAWLLLLWGTGESLARARLPSLSHALDTLRRGRLGAREGRELLLGWAGGAALAGARLLLFAAAARLGDTASLASMAPLPLFGVTAHPLRHGVMWTGALLLALACGPSRLTEPWRWLALPLVPLVVIPVPLAGWWQQYLAGALVTLGLLLVLRRGGVTAALVAALLAHWWPSAAVATRHPGWLPVTLGVSVAVLVLPPVAAIYGLRRGELVGRDAAALPEFLRREERERRLTHEMDLLAQLQLGLLPRRLPRLAGYQVTARSMLANEAGGDLYDFLRDERGRLWIAAGDVSGHGYSCAIGQASVKASLHSLVDGETSPAHVLAGIDRVLRSSLGVRMFATLALLCLDEATGRILLANAGHPFPVIVDRREGAREVELPGLPLGQGPPRRYHEVELALSRGGLLVLFSDGLYEATDPHGRPYGFERPRQVLAEAASGNAAEVLERLVFDWGQHLAGTPIADDTTIVVLKRL